MLTGTLPGTLSPVASLAPGASPLSPGESPHSLSCTHCLAGRTPGARVELGQSGKRGWPEDPLKKNHTAQGELTATQTTGLLGQIWAQQKSPQPTSPPGTSGALVFPLGAETPHAPTGCLRVTSPTHPAVSQAARPSWLTLTGHLD